MELSDFKRNNFVQIDAGLAKVVRDESLTVVTKDGIVHHVTDCSRVYLSHAQFKVVPGIINVGDNSFVLPGLPGHISYNKTRMSYEWVVDGCMVKSLDYIDDLQNLYFYCTGNELFK